MSVADHVCGVQCCYSCAYCSLYVFVAFVVGVLVIATEQEQGCVKTSRHARAITAQAITC